MISEIFKDIFQIKVTLPYSPLKHLNSYLIISENRNLLIDTGLNFTETFQALSRGLEKVGLKIESLTDILLTHFHVDHVGLIPRLTRKSAGPQLLIHRVEADLSKEISQKFENYMNSMKKFLRAHGAPSFISENLVKYHPAFFVPQAYQQLAATDNSLEDGNQIVVGQYCFKVVWTPGHSPGHVCLYEPTNRMLISGDHLLPTISPHVAQFMEDMDPLGDYLKSLEKIEKLKVDIVLPAHEENFTDCYSRIKQLKDHHKRRLNEILEELEKGENLTAFELASKLHWDVKYNSWEDFPPFQKYLALGETVAHLNVLEKNKMVDKNKVKEIFLYSKR
jgi:glyoxylase-like metal-dependent hydrolase (beta-lactamase superfamily II)